MSRYRAMKNYDMGGNVGMQDLSKHRASLLMPGYQEGGPVSGYTAQLRGLGQSVGRRRKEFDKMQDKWRDIKRKAGRAGGGGFLGGLFGSIIDKLSDAALLAAFPGVGIGLIKAKDYLFDPLVTGALAKYGAEKAYGSKVSFDKSPWFKSAKEEASGFQKDVRAGFQDIGQAYGLQAFGMQAVGDVIKSTKPKISEAVTEWGADKPKYLGDWGARTFGIGGDKFASQVTKEGLAVNPWLAREDINGYDFFSDKSFWDWNEGFKEEDKIQKIIHGYQEGGYVNDSLLHRTFGNKSNLY